MPSTALTRTIKLYIDPTAPYGQNPVALRNAQGSINRTSEPPRFIQRDNLTLQLWFADTAGTNYRLATGFGLVFAAKTSKSASGTLFNCTSFAEMGADGGYYYEGTLNLNTTDFVAVADNATLYCGIEYQNGDNSQRMSFEFTGTSVKDTYAGTEGSPVDGDPLYPSASNIVVKYIAQSGAAIGNGASSVTVDISSHALAAAPKVILLQVSKPTSADLNLFATLRQGWTATSFIADLSGVTDSANYKLHYLLIS